MNFLITLPSWEEIFRGLMALLCQVIYPIIGWLYNLFINVSKVNILSSNEIQPIYQRVTMILTIIMVFYITFEFVKYIVQPDSITDKEKGVGSIGWKLVAVVALIAFVPTIFTGAFKLQTAIVDKGIIGKVILGKNGSVDSNFGPHFSSQIFSMFYSVNEEYADEECGDDKIPCGALVGMNIKTLREDGHLKYLTAGLNTSDTTEVEVNGKKQKVTTTYINFDGLIAVIVGGIIAYILVLYCIDVGVRWAQMIFLQIIAPIPIIGFLSPKKDGIFQKWCKQCLTTYLDLFLRTAIIYFVLLICNILLDSKAGNGEILSGITGLNGMMETFVYIVLILGVMMFAQKAPKMLSELFPSTGAASGNFGLKAKDRGLGNTGRILGAVTGGAAGALVGAATGIGQGWRRSKALGKNGKAKGAKAGIWGATKGAVSGLVGGAARGMYNGGKKGNALKNSISGAQKQIQANRRFGNREENGYGIFSQARDVLGGAIGAKSRIEILEEQKAPIKRHQEMNEKISKAKSDMESEAESAARKGKGKYSGELASAEKRLQNIKDNQNFTNETRNNIKNSSLYRQKCLEIDNDPTNVNKSAEDIAKMKDDLLEDLTNESVDKQLTAAQKAVKDAKDKAVFDIITNGEYKGTDAQGNDIYEKNARISSIKNSIITEMKEYNKYNNNSEFAINEELVKSAMADGDLFDALIKGKNVQIPMIDETGHVKTDAQGNIMYYQISEEDGINNKVDADKNKLVGLVQHQEAIKRQTEGSGINEGKK